MSNKVSQPSQPLLKTKFPTQFGGFLLCSSLLEENMLFRCSLETMEAAADILDKQMVSPVSAVPATASGAWSFSPVFCVNVERFFWAMAAGRGPRRMKRHLPNA